MRQRFAHLLFCLALLPALSSASEQTASTQEPNERVLEKVILQLPWKHQFEFAGFYAAIEKGFYRRYGLDVEVKEYQANLDITDEVLSGRAHYGFSNNRIFLDRRQGKPLVLLANYFKRMPLVILTKPGTHSLEELKGKRLMISEKDLNSPLIHVALQTAGLVPDINIEIVPHSFGVTSFIRGEVDAITAYRSNEPFLLESKGVPFQLIDLASYLPSLGDGYLISSEGEVEQHRERTLNFLRASNEGWRYALSHPDEITDLILSSYSLLKGEAALRFEAIKIHQLVQPTIFPIGSILEGRIHAMADNLLESGSVPNLDYLDGFVLDPNNNLQSHTHDTIKRPNTPLNNKNSLPKTKPQPQPKQGLLFTEEEERWLKAHPTLRVAYSPTWGPIEFADDREQHQGMTADYLNYLKQLLRVEFETTPVQSASEAKRVLSAKQVDIMLALNHSTTHEKSIHFTEPYLALPTAIFSAEKITYLSGLDALAGKRVAVVKGYAAHEWLTQDFPQLQLIVATNIENALKHVAKGEAYAFVGATIPALFYIHQLNLSDIKLVGETPYKYRLSMAVSKELPILASIIDKALQVISQEKRDGIYTKWITTHNKHAIDLTLLWQIVAIAFIALLFMLYWNHRLSKEIAGRQQAESRRKKAHQYVLGVTEAIGDGVIALDRDNHCSFVNPAAERLLGWSRSELLEKELCPLIYPAGLNNNPGQQSECIALCSSRTGKPYRSEEEFFQHRDGTIFPISITVVPFVKESMGGVVAVFQDISERKSNEETFKKLSTAVEQSPASIIITDKEGVIEYVNPEFESVTGYCKEEAIGESTRLLKSGHMPLEIYSDLWETVTTGGIWRGELLNRKKGGELYWVVTSICPIKSDTDEITHFIAVNENISQLKLHESELRLAKEVAEEANQAKSEFLANMSHEIRTPMNGVIGMSNLLKKTPLTEEQEEYLTGLTSSSNNLLEIINDILDFSKIEAKQLSLAAINFNLDHLLIELSHLANSLTQDKEITFIYPSQLPFSTQLIGDPLRLKQVLNNLIGNAVKFTEHGQITIDITKLESTDRTLQLQFAVKDTGIGIASSEQEKLFQPFTQADGSLTRHFGGTGLGLTICRQLVDMMGGEIWIESEPDKGSTIRFTAKFGLAPIKQAEDSAISAAPSIQDVQLPKGIHVLLAEDDRLNQVVAKKLLESYGVQVSLANNGQEAVDAVKQQPFDLVLMDIQMPELDGYQATAEIRKEGRFSHLPIIAMTAHAMMGEREKCLTAGMNDHFPKPFEPHALEQLLHQWVGSGSSTVDTNSQAEIKANLEKLVKNMSKTSALTSLDTLLKHLPDRMSQLIQAISDGDHPTTKKQAHKLQGSLNLYGSKRLTQLLSQIEKKSDLSQEAKSITHHLRVEFELALKLIQEAREQLVNKESTF